MAKLGIGFRFATVTPAAIGCALMLVACGANAQQSDAQSEAQQVAHNTLTDAERAAGWRLLFDGETMDGWRVYMRDSISDGWQAVDGALTRVGRGRDIVTIDQFTNFELTLEWQLREAGNSGVFYRAAEGPDLIYYGAPEMQILDDNNHNDGQSQLTSAGANYGIHPAPRGVVKPIGEWNSVRLIVNGDHVEHWLNGKKIIEYEFNSDDWRQRVEASKFRQWPEYGQAARGHIGLQDHGTWVAFRDIKIREIQ